MRQHRDYTAYSFLQQPLSAQSVRLASLKLEVISIANARRRYVDAILLDGDKIVPVPFLGIADNGDILFHEHHLPLGNAALEWLKSVIAQWVAQKPLDADLQADVFQNDAEISRAFVESCEVFGRALPGMSTYGLLFDEAERYATLSPYVYNRSVIDFNAGYGYGVATLKDIARDIAAASGTLQPIARRVVPQVHEASPQSKFDIAVWLDVPEDKLSSSIEHLRNSLASEGLAIISLRGSDAKEKLLKLGADVLRMARPGADALGALNEWLGVFSQSTSRKATTPAPRTTIEVSPRPLRVLFGLRPSAEHIFGGDVVQVRETAQALRERGHFVEVSTALHLDGSGFDIVHLSNLTVPPETLPQARSVANFDGPVVMMPIFTDHADEAAWGMFTSLALFAGSESEDDLTAKLQALETRMVAMQGFPAPPQRADMVANYTQMQREILRYVDFAVANAHAEMHRVYRYIDSEIPYAVAPSCANPVIYGTHQKNRFVERFGLSDFVLLPGRYEHRKNQLMFFRAVADLSLPIVCIGGNNDIVFAGAMRRHRPRTAVYIGHIAEEDLAGAFAAARVVAIPSWDEVVTLTSLNAAISQASMVLTRNSYEHEYFADDAEYCDPGSVESIRRAVLRAWNTHADRAERRAALADRVRTECNWDRSAELTEAAYYRVLAFNPRGERRLESRPT